MRSRRDWPASGAGRGGHLRRRGRQVRAQERRVHERTALDQVLLRGAGLPLEEPGEREESGSLGGVEVHGLQRPRAHTVHTLNAVDGGHLRVYERAATREQVRHRPSAEHDVVGIGIHLRLHRARLCQGVVLVRDELPRNVLVAVHVQELAVRAVLDRDKEAAFHAVALDPLTAALLPLHEIRAMFEEMWVAEGALLNYFDE